MDFMAQVFQVFVDFPQLLIVLVLALLGGILYAGLKR